MFIQSCFIRKNTPELRKKLEELGYKYNGRDTESWGASALYCFDGKYYEVYPAEPSRYHSIVDCGTNEELFLSLSALRDDSDYMQWFICDDNESMFKVDKPNMSMSKFIHEYMDGWDVSGARKATVKEIIEHLNNGIMIREEEIKQAAQAYYPSGSLYEYRTVPAFVRGAKWADENQPGMSKMRKDYELLFTLKKQELIKKACEWLEDCAVVDIEEFRKAMEE